MLRSAGRTNLKHLICNESVHGPLVQDCTTTPGRRDRDARLLPWTLTDEKWVFNIPTMTLRNSEALTVLGCRGRVGVVVLNFFHFPAPPHRGGQHAEGLAHTRQSREQKHGLKWESIQLECFFYRKQVSNIAADGNKGGAEHLCVLQVDE